MKKKFLLLLMTALIATAGWAQADSLVVWFSCTGNTEELAHTAAQALNADLWQIVPKEPYMEEDLDYNVSSCRANTDQHDETCRPAIAGEVDLAAYDRILLAYPIWWGQEPRIIDTWIESQNLNGKRLAAVCTSGGSGVEQSYQRLQAMAPDAQWAGAKRFSANASLQQVSDWLKEIKLVP